MLRPKVAFFHFFINYLYIQNTKKNRQTKCKREFKKYFTDLFWVLNYFENQKMLLKVIEERKGIKKQRFLILMTHNVLYSAL